jgi:hypothetical protein
MILDLFQLGESTTHIQHQKADLFKSFEKFIQILSEYPSAKTSILESYGVPFDKLFVSHPGYKNFLTEGFIKMVITDHERRFYLALHSVKFPPLTKNQNTKAKFFKDGYFLSNVKNMLEKRLTDSKFSDLLMVRTGSLYLDNLEPFQFLNDQIDAVILEKLIGAEFNKNMEIFTDCVGSHPDILQFYTNRILQSKWPENSNQELLKFMATSKYFLKIYESIFKYHMLSPPWLEKLNSSLQFLISSINRVLAGEEKVGIIKLMETHIEVYTVILQRLDSRTLKDLKVNF